MRVACKVLSLASLFILSWTLMVEPSHGQSAIFPTGRPVLFGKGVLPHQIVNVPIDPSNSIVPVPGQQVGFFMPALRKLMQSPKTTSPLGTSVVPDSKMFPGTVFPQFNPIAAKK